ncbi:hypothetical protein BC936DRAFT_148267, partial [Jimgerdemannia flammicorona]
LHSHNPASTDLPCSSFDISEPEISVNTNSLVASLRYASRRPPTTRCRREWLHHAQLQSPVRVSIQSPPHHERLPQRGLHRIGSLSTFDDFAHEVVRQKVGESLRLSLALSITDLISSIALEIYTFSESSHGSVCTFAPFLIVWLSNQYLFLSVAIAFNLQYLFLFKRYFNPAFEKWYYILSVGLSLLSAALPLAMGRFGWDDAQGYC